MYVLLCIGRCCVCASICLYVCERERENKYFCALICFEKVGCSNLLCARETIFKCARDCVSLFVRECFLCTLHTVYVCVGSFCVRTSKKTSLSKSYVSRYVYAIVFILYVLAFEC